MVHTPELKQAGDFSAGISFDSNSEEPRIQDYQLAFSPINNLGITFTGFQFEEIGTDDFFASIFSANPTSYNIKRKSNDIGIGYYKNINKNIFFNLYGGLGYGETVLTSNSSIHGMERKRYTFSKQFVHLGLELYMFKKYRDYFSFSPFVRFTHVDGNIHRGKFNLILIEPGLSTTFGVKYIALKNEIFLSQNIQSVSYLNDLTYIGVKFGVQFYFSRIFRNNIFQSFRFNQNPPKIQETERFK